MIYQADFESNMGNIRAVWEGGEYVDLFPEGSDTPTGTINVWDHANDKPSIDLNAKAMATCVREWLWEMERGIEFEKITTREIDDLGEDS